MQLSNEFLLPEYGICSETVDGSEEENGSSDEEGFEPVSNELDR